MVAVPPDPKIYHITHVDNLQAIISSQGLVSDSERIACEMTCALVGMSKIKRRRLEEIEVTVHPGTTVGEYVPFYFCPRSIMLYILHKKNHPDLNYDGGQDPIIHLEADLNLVIGWLEETSKHWAFTDRNAGAYFAEFYNRQADLDRINWAAIFAQDFRDPQIKEGKQAEFLVHNKLPWTLVNRVGTINKAIASHVRQIMSGVSYQPEIVVKPDWYF